jgi:hypothetical protein
MIGPQNALWDLRPDQHSIGLVKNFQVSSEPTYVDLTQGAKGTTVYSVMTSNPVRAQMEVYEYSAKNLAYGLGLDGSALAPAGSVYNTAAAVQGNATPVTTITFISATNVATDFPVGAWVMIQDVTIPDVVHYAQLTLATATTGTAPTITHTLTFANHGLKDGYNFPAGSRVQVVNRVDVGSPAEQPFFAAKVLAVMPEANKPVALMFPKIRITRGFSMSFTTENFANLPYQFTPFDLLPQDPFYSTFRDKGGATLMTPT